MAVQKKKSLGQAIDEVVQAIEALDESSRLTAVKAACEHLNIPLGLPATHAPTPPGQTPPPTPESPPAPAIIDIRSLKESKSPRNAVEMACVVAYYLENHAPENERRSEMLRTDVEKYFKQADFPLPRVPGQVLLDAKAAGYFDSAVRGKYKLNPVGHNLVAHTLPRTKRKKS